MTDPSDFSSIDWSSLASANYGSASKLEDVPQPAVGWKCPVCYKGNAPWVAKCGHCSDESGHLFGSEPITITVKGCEHEWDYWSDTAGQHRTCRKCGYVVTEPAYPGFIEVPTIRYWYDV